MRSLSTDVWKEMDRMFDYWNLEKMGNYETRRASLATDLSENTETYTLSVDLPGLKKDDLKIEIIDNILSLSGERKSANSKRNFGTFKQNYSLPENVDLDGIHAKFEDGVLEMILPKKKAVTRQIEIHSPASEKINPAELAGQI